LVTSTPQIRFYAGAPLLSPDGFNLGALCVMDPRPRQAITERQTAMLSGLARLVVREIEARPQIEMTRQFEQQCRRLLRASDQFRHIVEKGSEGVWIFDAEGRTIYANANMASMLGYPVEAMLGRPSSDFVNAVTREQHEGRWAECLSGAAGRPELRFRRRDGSDLWTVASVRPRLDEDGGFAGAFAMLTDITDRKQLEVKLKEHETRFRALLDSEAGLRNAGRMAKFGDWLWFADVPGGWAEGRSEYSPEAAAILGRDPADLALGTTDYCAQIIHPEDGERVRALCQRVDEQRGDKYSVEYRIVRPDGEIRTVLEFAENTYDAARRIVRTAGTIQDVTELRRVEEHLRQAQKTEVMARITGGGAHDFH